MTYPQAGFKLEKKNIELSKIGKINFANHRNIEGKAKTCTINKTKSKEWYITLSVEKEDKQFTSNGKVQAGIDLGIVPLPWRRQFIMQHSCAGRSDAE